MEVFQRNGIQQRQFFVQNGAVEFALRRVMTRALRLPAASSVLRQLQLQNKAGRLKDADIALA
ncbi:hypothetical protein OG738_39395 [Amycolatopsis sp. NBC_01488]|uniref:hypothetical protein n=1 Tax=Amycolatopsis sp. NBC_01488 TaxID=2903563 RepID=UPI002E2D6879|nr:hypothetical protein [Amycolatopsis sp. NBC_01488]